jgi:hypothetical protein
MMDQEERKLGGKIFLGPAQNNIPLDYLISIIM